MLPSFQEQVFLLGIITEGYSYGNSIKNSFSPPPIPIIISKQMINLGLVIKSSELIKLINDSRNPYSVRKVDYQ